MLGLSTNEIMRRAVRSSVCPICRYRPPGSEALGPAFPRICESRCTLFENLEPLADIALDQHGNTRADYETEIVNNICLRCQAAPTAGDYCAERLARTCPLAIHALRALEVIEPIAIKRQNCECVTR
jgi:hypothetical protein